MSDTNSTEGVKNEAVKNNQGFILSFKRKIPEKVYRVISRPFFWTLRVIPSSILYSVGMKQRKANYPYNRIDEGDVVVQVGAPRDLLSVGRSRSVFFMQCVGEKGKLVIFEPDPESAKAMTAFVKKNGYADRVLLVNKGAWSEDTTLTFLSSPLHPAANLIKGAEEITDEEYKRRQYEEFHVDVTSMDKVFKEHGLATPKLVSITANGSEFEIIKGMKDMIAAGLPYISLAVTGDGYPEQMAKNGYKLDAYDDRGFTFKQEKPA